MNEMAAKKKPAAGKRSEPTVSEQTGTAQARKNAEEKGRALAERLRADLQSSREALRAAQVAAKTDLKLAREAAAAEMALLKEQLAAALKREKELVAMAEKKAQMMLAAGAKWEKEQLKKIQSIGTARKGKDKGKDKPKDAKR